MDDHSGGAGNEAQVFELLNKFIEGQLKALTELHNKTIKYASDETKEKMKNIATLAKTSEDYITSLSDAERKAFEQLHAEKIEKQDAQRKELKKKILELYKAQEDEETRLSDEDFARKLRAAQFALDAHNKAVNRENEILALKDELAKREAARITSSENQEIKVQETIKKLRDDAEAAELKRRIELDDEYNKHREESLKKYIERQGESIENLSDEQLEAIEAEFDARFISQEEFEKRELEKDKKKNKKIVIDGNKTAGENFRNAFDGIKDAGKDALKAKAEKYVKKNDDGTVDISGAFNALAGFVQSLNGKMAEAGKPQSKIDTRLYGSTANGKSVLGSYWQEMSGDIMSIAGASPLLLQTDMIASLTKLVDSGISHNLKLRAFLDATADKIATTFEVSDSTMLRLIRMQQQDTTAARMGMESALNAFLNNMFETTEYLSKLADSVRGNLEEAQALMGAKEATEFEYQVQKWMGSMYSVGMSDSAVTNISTTIGQLAAGQIEALTSSGTGNLMIMAANEAGISIADILQNGLNADTTNKLMQAMVEYLAQIAQQSDSKVIQQQLAGVFGMKASDIQSVMNLVADNSKTIKNIAKTNVTNEGMITELMMRAATMTMRVSTAEMMNNMWENVQYSMASGIANNPATYALYKMSGLLEDTTGGIDLPFLNVYGFGVDLNTSVAQLMQVGAMAGGIMSVLPNMISGLANAVGGGTTMLLTAGLLGQGKTINRGNGAVGVNALSRSGASTSSSGLVGNASTDDMTNATMASGEDDKDAIATQGKEENEDATRDDIIDILKMLFGMIGEKIDENTNAVRGGGGLYNKDSNIGGFTNASTTFNSVV